MFGMNERTYLSFEYSNRVNKPNSCTTKNQRRRRRKDSVCFFLKRKDVVCLPFFFKGTKKIHAKPQQISITSNVYTTSKKNEKACSNPNRSSYLKIKRAICLFEDATCHRYFVFCLPRPPFVDFLVSASGCDVTKHPDY